MTILKTCLLIGLVALAAAGDCGAGGVICPTGTCHYPSYIEGCAVYASPTACQQCEFNYVKNGNICAYSPPSDYSACCRAYNSITGQCVQCASGLVLVDGKCQDRKIVGCLKKDQSGSCTNCALQYNLFGGQCFKKIAGCSKYSSTGSCQACDVKYDFANGVCIPKISSSDSCSLPWINDASGSCSIPGCTNQYDYGCAICQDGLRLLPDGSCKNGKIDGCVRYNLNGACQACKRPLYTEYSGWCLSYGCIRLNDQGRCVECDTSKGFGLGVDGFCKISNCLVSNEKQCLVCEQGFVETQGGCVRQEPIKYCTTCSIGYYLSQTGDCQPRQPGCLAYDRYRCSKCEEQYYLSVDYKCIRREPGCIYANGICSDCLAPFKKTTNGLCAIQGCIQFLGNGCKTCKSPYVLVSGRCSYLNCVQVSGGVCLACVDGYAVGRDGFCYKTVPFCKAYSMDSKCIECSLGYYLDKSTSDAVCREQKFGCNYIDGKCVSCRAPFNYVPETQSCEIDGCLTYFLGGCSQCSANYDLRYNSCKLPNCLISHKGHCAQCDPDYIMKSDGSCVNKDEFCWNYDSNGVCTQCAPNYYMSKLKNKCQPREPGCLYNDKDRCFDCQKPFYFDGVRCEIYGCMKLSPKGCDTCMYPMYVVKETGLCSVVNCDRMDGAKCAICKPGFVIASDGSCKNQDPNCLVTNEIGCKKCVKGYRLDGNGYCQYTDEHCWDFSPQGSCTNCDRLYFLNRYNKCEIKDNNCAAYSGGKCIECKSYFYNFQGLCYPNAKGCILQKNVRVCEKCESGYVLGQGVCTPQITKLDWNSVDMDFWGGDSDDKVKTSKEVFTIGKTNKYNLDGAISKGKAKILYSSIVTGRTCFQVDDNVNFDGWTPSSSNNEFLGIVLQSRQVFYALDIKFIQGSTLTKFAVERSDDGKNFIRVSEFVVSQKTSGTVETYYFTAVEALSMRIVVLQGVPNIKFEFYYSNGQAVYPTENSTYIQDQTGLAVIDSLKGQVFETTSSCVDKQLCWMGLQLCDAKPIQAFALSLNAGSSGSIDTVTVKYSTDGVQFQCYNNCQELTLKNGAFSFSPSVTATKLRVYPGRYTGSPSCSITFTY